MSPSFVTRQRVGKRRLSGAYRANGREGLDDFTRARELLGLATGRTTAGKTLRIGELKAMLALAGGDLEAGSHLDPRAHGVKLIGL
ncbi:hypothetical protein ACNKHR_01975 [Shigella flexneri]